jgi:hypothetical protein
VGRIFPCNPFPNSIKIYIYISSVHKVQVAAMPMIQLYFIDEELINPLHNNDFKFETKTIGFVSFYGEGNSTRHQSLA